MEIDVSIVRYAVPPIISAFIMLILGVFVLMTYFVTWPMIVQKWPMITAWLKL